MYEILPIKRTEMETKGLFHINDLKTVAVNLHADHTERGQKWISIALKLHEAQQMKKHFASIESELRANLEELSEDESSKGGDFVFTRFMSKGAVQYKEIPELSGVDLDSYRKPGYTKWKLTKV